MADAANLENEPAVDHECHDANCGKSWSKCSRGKCMFGCG